MVAGKEWVCLDLWVQRALTASMHSTGAAGREGVMSRICGAASFVSECKPERVFLHHVFVRSCHGTGGDAEASDKRL